MSDAPEAREEPTSSQREVARKRIQKRRNLQGAVSPTSLSMRSDQRLGRHRRRILLAGVGAGQMGAWEWCWGSGTTTGGR